MISKGNISSVFIPLFSNYPGIKTAYILATSSKYILITHTLM